MGVWLGKVCKSILLVQPSSAAAERVFPTPLLIDKNMHQEIILKPR